MSLNQNEVHKNIWLAWILLSVGLILTSVAAIYTKIEVEADGAKAFESVCTEIQLRISARMDAHAQILRSAAAFFDASDHVTRDSWKNFTTDQKVEQYLPGIQGIGFSLMIPRERLPQHIQEIHRQGFADYKVRPEGDRALYTSIIYLEPFSGRNLRAIGYDMFSEPVRRAAMELARDADAAVLSGKVTLVQESNQNIQAGVLIYIPVYMKGTIVDTIGQRRAALHGWVYSPYRMNDLMGGIWGGGDKKRERQIRLQIFDDEQISPDSMLYDSEQMEDGPERDDISRLALQIPLAFHHHTWHLRFTQTTGQVEYGKVYGILVSGAITSLLLFGFVFSLLNTRFRAQQLAGQLTAGLRESKEMLSLILNSTAEGVYGIDKNGCCTFSNKACVDQLGYDSKEELLGKNMHDLIHHTLPS